MSWTPPRTWNAGSMTTAALLNAHLRDNLSLLATEVQTSGGWLCPGVKNFAYVTGQGNAAGGGDTQLTSYDVTIPAVMGQAGDALIIEGVWLTDATAGSRTAKLQLGSGTLVTLITTSQVSVSIPFRLILRRRTSTTGSVTGIHWIGTVPETLYLKNATLTSQDFGASQTLKFFASGSTSNMLKLIDLRVTWALALSGRSV